MLFSIENVNKTASAGPPTAEAKHTEEPDGNLATPHCIVKYIAPVPERHAPIPQQHSQNTLHSYCYCYNIRLFTFRFLAMNKCFDSPSAQPGSLRVYLAPPGNRSAGLFLDLLSLENRMGLKGSYDIVN